MNEKKIINNVLIFKKYLLAILIIQTDKWVNRIYNDRINTN